MYGSESSMKENQKKMSCGACSNDTFKVFGDGSIQELNIECTKCKSVTVITPKEPSLEKSFGEGSEGVLCFMGD